mmetsp:Transcript_26637/g.52485  ORF Transcript_26637/g.52485 Transcript_26637/m.52485 type:complete len:311 (+) Transcript_26637:961-1893(+)
MHQSGTLPLPVPRQRVHQQRRRYAPVHVRGQGLDQQDVGHGSSGLCPSCTRVHISGPVQQRQLWQPVRGQQRRHVPLRVQRERILQRPGHSAADVLYRAAAVHRQSHVPQGLERAQQMCGQQGRHVQMRVRCPWLRRHQLYRCQRTGLPAPGLHWLLHELPGQQVCAANQRQLCVRLQSQRVEAVGRWLLLPPPAKAVPEAVAVLRSVHWEHLFRQPRRDLLLQVRGKGLDPRARHSASVLHRAEAAVCLQGDLQPERPWQRVPRQPGWHLLVPLQRCRLDQRAWGCSTGVCRPRQPLHTPSYLQPEGGR